VCGEGGGLSVQNVSFEWADGSAGTVNELVRWADGDLLLLVFGDLDAGARERLRALAGTAPVRVVQVVVGERNPQALEHVRDPQGTLQGACHLSGDSGFSWALVRPDAYVAATGESVDARLVEAVGAALALTEGATA
jgi:3-(3-hydroxy-phenyl)propionate hydroxylase